MEQALRDAKRVTVSEEIFQSFAPASKAQERLEAYKKYDTFDWSPEDLETAFESLD